MLDFYISVILLPMWLFDNIFLDEDATANTTAVMEKVEEASPEIVPPEQAYEVPSQGETSEPVSAETNTTIQTPENVSFDIGGDLDFWASPSTDATNQTNPEAPVEATQEPSVVDANLSSFTVNWVAYNTQDAPDNTTTTETADTIEAPQESIAMIQGSTAATGINIIDSTPVEAVSDSTLASTDTSAESNPFINILSSDSPEESQETAIASTTSEPEAMFSLTDVVSPESETPSLAVVNQEDFKDLEKESDIIVASDSPSSDEIAKPADPIQEASNEIIASSVSTESNTSDISGILGGFIQELNEREMEINRIIMKRRELAKRRTEFEEDYKTRILALNMEDEFLKSKAERERAEQDKLQHVIKSFQKQIAANE